MTQDLSIVQLDFDDNYATVVDLIFYNLGLSRAYFAKSYAQAEKYINEVSRTKAYPDIVLVDSYLGRGSSDGESIARKLKDLNAKTTIIAYTADDEAKWGDYLALKSGDGEDSDLIKILEKLTGKAFNYDNAKK